MRPIVIDVAWSVHLCVCLCVYLPVGHSHEPCKDGWTDQMPFGMETLVGPWNHVLDGDPDPTKGRDKFGETPDDGAIR